MRIKIPQPPFHVDWCDAVYDTEMREFNLFPKYGKGNPRVFSMDELLSIVESAPPYYHQDVRWLLQNCGEAKITPSQATKFTTKSAKLLLL